MLLIELQSGKLHVVVREADTHSVGPSKLWDSAFATTLSIFDALERYERVWRANEVVMRAVRVELLYGTGARQIQLRKERMSNNSHENKLC